MSAAAIYTRISQDREGREVGVGNQEAACRDLAAREVLPVVAMFSDNDTGASTRTRKDRPGFAGLLDAARRGDVTHVLAYSNSRLTRRPREFEDLIELHERFGVRFLTVVSGNDDLSTADGRMVARIKAASDAAEAERTGERVKFRQQADLARGRDIGGRRPFGFEDDREAIRESEAELIRRGVRMIVEDGASLRAVARAWDAAGVREVRFRSQTVRDILIRPRNTGRLVVAGVDYGAGDRPAILTEDDRDALLAVLANPARKPRRGRESYTWTAVSVVTCGVCGGTVETTSNKGKTVIRCAVRGGGLRHPTASAELVEEQLSLAALSGVLARMVSGRDEGGPGARELQAEIADLSARRARATSAMIDGDLDEATARRMSRELGARITELTRRLDDAIANRDGGSAVEAARAFVIRHTGGVTVQALNAMEAWAGRWKNLPVESRRALLRALHSTWTLEPYDRENPWRIAADGARTVPRDIHEDRSDFRPDTMGRPKGQG